jgi:catalase
MAALPIREKSDLTGLVEASVHKVKSVLDSKSPSVVESAKTKSLQSDTKNADTSTQPFTTDFGLKVSNNESFLKIVSEKSTGPQLLEDEIGRERVS